MVNWQIWLKNSKKISIWMLISSAIFFVALVITLILDYSFCPKEELAHDIVLTCHDSLLWPFFVMGYLWIILLFLGLPMFIITKIVLWRKSKKVNNER